jgi:hypothetical protein
MTKLRALLPFALVAAMAADAYAQNSSRKLLTLEPDDAPQPEIAGSVQLPEGIPERARPILERQQTAMALGIINEKNEGLAVWCKNILQKFPDKAQAVKFIHDYYMDTDNLIGDSYASEKLKNEYVIEFLKSHFTITDSDMKLPPQVKAWAATIGPSAHLRRALELYFIVDDYMDDEAPTDADTRKAYAAIQGVRWVIKWSGEDPDADATWNEVWPNLNKQKVDKDYRTISERAKGLGETAPSQNDLIVQVVVPRGLH